MISAKEARRITDDVSEKKRELQRKNSLSSIENMIIDASNKGNYSVTYEGYFDELLIQTLKENGYYVTCGREEKDNILIKW